MTIEELNKLEIGKMNNKRNWKINRLKKNNKKELKDLTN